MRTIGMTGKHHSESTKAKMREAALGRKHTAETRRKISEDCIKRWQEGRMDVSQIQKFIEAGANATRGRKRPNLQRSNNSQWKGDNASYVSIHKWVSRNWGKPKSCEFCGTTSYHRYEWANISGRYIRERYDWIRLCVPCHRQEAAGRIAIVTRTVE